MTYFVINEDLHTAHTVIPLSETEKKIKAEKAKSIYINGCYHTVYTKVEDAKARLALLFLHGHQA